MRQFRANRSHLAKHGFTLMEVMLVIVIIGLITAIAIPNFTKSLEVSYEQDAVAQLKTIHGAQLLYRTRNAWGVFWNPSSADLATINTTLHLNILANSSTYTCQTHGADLYYCQAARTGGTYTVAIRQTGIPYCAAGTCPSCTGVTCD